MVAREKGSEAVAMNQTTKELRSDREIVITRTFNGPPRIVFDAWTRPELVKRWWAPGSRGVAECEADVRPGGRYRYVIRLDGGHVFAFSGKYIEVVPPSRLVYTEVFEPTASGANPDDAGLIVTVTFDEHEGKTDMVSHSLCPSKEVRDQILASGMEQGMRQTMDQLDELVASLV